MMSSSTRWQQPSLLLKRSRRAVGARAFLLTDQIIASLVTFALSAIAARSSSASQYGVFALIYSLSWILLGTSRAIFGETTLLSWPTGVQAQRDRGGQSAGYALCLGLLFSGFLAISALTWWPYDKWLLFVLSVILPGLLWQDALRYYFFAVGKPALAASLDGFQLVCVIWLGLGAQGIESGPVLVLMAWGGGAGISAILMTMVAQAPVPRLRGFADWRRAELPLGIKLVADFAASNGIGQFVYLMVPIVSTISLAGALRAGSVALGPLNVVLSAVTVALVPALRSRFESGRDTRNLAGRIALCWVVACPLMAMALAIVPDSVGQTLLGASWHEGSKAAPFLAVAAGLQAAAQAAVQVLRVIGSAGRAVIIRVGASSLLAMGMLIGAAQGEAEKAALGSALASAVTCVVWWAAAWRLDRKRIEIQPPQGSHC